MALSDEKRRIVDVNPALVRLLGYRPSDMRGRYLWEFADGGPLLTHEQWRELLGMREATGEVGILCADGNVARAQFAVYPEVVTGQHLVLFVALTVSRWGRHFRRDPADSGPDHSLSNREREVLHLVALGATSPEIANQLHISHNTVRKHVNSAMRKLGARSRAHLVAKAFGDGMIER